MAARGQLSNFPSMNRYYFHTLNGIADAIDRKGVELPDINAATDHARKRLADVIAEEVAGGCDHVNVVVMVDDADGARVVTLNSESRVVNTIDPFAT
jgi:hypothetical protein